MIFFSVIIVTHAREELLLKCLNSLSPGIENWELIVVANGKDLTPELKLKVSSLTPYFKIIENDTQLSPGRTRNQGIEKAEGDWIFFIDDDAYTLKGYWEKALPLLSESKIDVFGGPDCPPPGMGMISESLALTLASPLCTGPTFLRHKSFGTTIQAADEKKLSSCNLWLRKSALEGIKFPEDYLRGEETPFLLQLKQRQKNLFYVPTLKVGHFRRSKITSILHSTFFAGYYRSKTMRKNLSQGDGLFWTPVLFVLMHLIGLVDSSLFFYFARMYLGLVFFMSVAIALPLKKIFLVPLMVFLHHLIVFTYGLGFLFERLRREKKHENHL